MKNLSLKINDVLFEQLSVAENYREMLEGLKERRSLGKHEGMVYVFREDCSRDFVNENPFLDIDVIMVDAAETIQAVHTMKRADPGGGGTEEGLRKNCPACSSPRPYRYVFELKAGTARKLKAVPGSRLRVDFSALYPYRNAENIRYAFQLKKINLPTGWEKPVLADLKAIIDSPDPLRQLNLDFAGAQLDPEALTHMDWVLLEGIDPGSAGNIWLQKRFAAGEIRIAARLCVSPVGHFRYLYLLSFAEDGSFQQETAVEFRDAVSVLLRTDLEKTQKVPRFPSREEELENIVGPLLTSTDPGKKWTEQEKFFVWVHELARLKTRSRFYSWRLLNGMLPFDRFCDDEPVLSSVLLTAAELKYRWGMARAAFLALTRAAESGESMFWNHIGCILDRLDEKSAALCCFVRAWNLEFDPGYAKNLWLMGDEMIPELLKQEKWKDVYFVASAMLSAISPDATVKRQVELFCMVGLVYEAEGDVEEAGRYYTAAIEIFRRRRAAADDIALRWDFPMLYQAWRRCRITDPESRRPYLLAQLKSFPQTPLEAGYGKRVPVQYVEGEGHGDHWKCVTPKLPDNPEQFLREMIEKGKKISESERLPEYERGDGEFQRGIVFRYCPEEDRDAPLESYFLVGDSATEKICQFVSAYPVFKKGRGCSLVRKLNSFQVWGNALEATVDFDLVNNRNTLSFFLPDYCSEFSRLERDTAYRIELGVFAYSVKHFKEQEIKIRQGPLLEEAKLRLRREGKKDDLDSVSLFLGGDMCNISRSFSGMSDDVSLIAPVERTEHFTFHGWPCLTLWVRLDERGANLTLPIFIYEGKLRKGMSFQPGDVIDCFGWLQGWVHEARALEEIVEIPLEAEEDFDFDFEQSLLSGVRGTGYDLTAAAEKALTVKAGAEAVQPCPEPLPGDPDYSCRINGENRFVKVMTGYFATEKACLEAWREFKSRVCLSPGIPAVAPLAVVGIKLCDDQYKVYYCGFSEINPEAGEEELTLP